MNSHTIVFHTIFLSRRIKKIIGFKLPPVSLSYTEASALLVVDSQKEISQTGLASFLHLEPASIVSLIDRLGKLNLVKRKKTADRRKYGITLTEKGKEKAKQIKKVVFKLDKFFTNRLSQKEAQQFLSTLNKLTAYLDDWRGGENEIPSPKRPLASRLHYEIKTVNP